MTLASRILSSFKIKENLNPKIWTKNANGNVVLKPDIRKKLLSISSNFLDFIDVEGLECNVTTKECDIQDITITGSIANYNWSEFSDIDLHLILDFDNIDENEGLVKNILNTKKNLWNSSHDVTINGYEVEVYTQDSKETHFSSGVYSVLFNKWVVDPKPEDVVEVDVQKVLDKAKGWMEIIDGLQHKSYDSPSEDILEIIEKVKNRLKKFRSCGLETGGEFSYENLAFKFLRRSGYLKKLFKLKNKLIDNELSLN
tara:strand:- start:9501 stop:10268 length:768 start_codon:yes stop_codon:yes gene_type:complete